MSILARDLRYALRAFARSPGFTAAAILSLAIGIGANTAIFSITSALLLRPLPYKDADRLVIMQSGKSSEIVHCSPPACFGQRHPLNLAL